MVGLDISTLQRAVLPLQSLGWVCTGVVHKAMTVVHLIFLVAGLGEQSMRKYYEVVGPVVTDAGWGAGVADFPDVISSYLGGGATLAGGGFLFPVGMKCIGWNHPWDWIAQHTLQAMRFHPKYLEMCKLIAQFLRVDQRLILLRKGASAERVESLKRFSASFAKWRWGTQRKVVARSIVVQAALQESRDPGNFEQSRNSSEMSLLSEAITDEGHWLENEAVAMLTKFTEEARMWGNGCACHRDLCIEFASKGKTVDCPMKGRVAPHIASFLEDR